MYDIMTENKDEYIDTQTINFKKNKDLISVFQAQPKDNHNTISIVEVGEVMQVTDHNIHKFDLNGIDCYIVSHIYDDQSLEEDINDKILTLFKVKLYKEKKIVSSLNCEFIINEELNVAKYMNMKNGYENKDNDNDTLTNLIGSYQIMFYHGNKKRKLHTINKYINTQEMLDVMTNLLLTNEHTLELICSI